MLFSGPSHDVVVTFHGQMFGSFRQAVMFHFDEGLLVQKKLVVDVGSLEQYHKISAERRQMQFTRWTDNNSDIIYRDDFEVQETKYPVPDPDELGDLNCSDDVLLSEGNYFARMHRMLYLEEITCLKTVSR